MTSFILACTLWGAPNVELVQIPVSEFGMADMNQQVGQFQFEASVIEEGINYIKISHPLTESSTQANAPGAAEKSVSLRMNVKNSQASLDCDVVRKAD